MTGASHFDIEKSQFLPARRDWPCRQSTRRAGCATLLLIVTLLVGATPAEAGRGGAAVRATRARALRTLRAVKSFSPRAHSKKLCARYRAGNDFKRYVARNPQVAEIYEEEKERATVHVARRSVILNVAAAAISFAVGFAQPVAVLSGLIAAVQAENQIRNQSSKLMKARGATLERARALSAIDSSVEAPDIADFLARDLVRAGDVPSQGQRAR